MPFRLIARLDVKAPNLIKGVHLEGLRVIGDPHAFAVRYANEGADELLYMDCVASLYGRNQISELLERTTDDTFIPVTVGGGIRTLADVDRAFRSGADKVAINTAALNNPGLINSIAQRYGSQALVVSVEAKRVSDTRIDSWECYTDNGREKTGRDVCEWIFEAVDRGAGEILLTSIDQEGTRKGFDLDLISLIGPAVPVPVIASGGCGSPEHVMEAMKAGADAVAVADCLHYNRFSVSQLKPL